MLAACIIYLIQTCIRVAEIQVRLVDGAREGEGRVEVYREGVWGTVCDNQWDDLDATVVCRMLGYVGPGTSHRETVFGPGSGDIILDQVYCAGTEATLGLCPTLAVSDNCLHGGAAGVTCPTGNGN